MRSDFYLKSMDHPGKVASLARGELNRKKNEYSLFALLFAPENLASRDGAVPSRVSLLVSILRVNLGLTHGIPPDSAIYFFKLLLLLFSSH